MNTTDEQRSNIEAGHAGVYVSRGGKEYYIESVMDINGQPSAAYKGCVYAFDAEGELVLPDAVEIFGEVPKPFPSLSHAKIALDIV